MNLTELAMSYKFVKQTSGGGSGGGLSIKKIEFTDRPTAWEWLKSNYHKAIKATLSASIMPVALIYNTFNAIYDLDANEITSIYLTAMNPDTIAENGVNYLHRLLKITETGTTALTGANSIALKTTPTITMDGVQPQTLPDVYWAQLSASLTVYYIE